MGIRGSSLALVLPLVADRERLLPRQLPDTTGLDLREQERYWVVSPASYRARPPRPFAGRAAARTRSRRRIELLTVPRQQCVRQGREEDYHGIAIHPRHLSWYERVVLKRQKHCSSLDRLLSIVPKLTPRAPANR